MSNCRWQLSLLPLLAMTFLARCMATNAVTGVAPHPPGAFSVALLLPGPADDRSWNQAGYEGLRLIKRELGACVLYRENVAEPDVAAAFRRFAAEGVDLAMGHGSQFYPAAEAFPPTKFAVVGNFSGNNKNLGALSMHNDQAGYLVGSWTDQARARELAPAQLARGADVLIQNADSAGLGVIDEARTAGAQAIGWVQDQHALAPETIIASAIQHSDSQDQYAALTKEAALAQQYAFF